MRTIGFFKRKQQIQPDEQELKKKMREQQREELYALVDEVCAAYTPDSIHFGIGQSLDRKRFVNPSYEQYQEAMLRSVIYIAVVKEQVHHLVYAYVKWGRGDRDEPIMNKVEAVKKEVLKDLESHMMDRFDTYFEQFLTTDHGISGLEREYIEGTIYNSLLTDLCHQLHERGYVLGEGVSGKWLLEELENAIRFKLSQLLYSTQGEYE